MRKTKIICTLGPATDRKGVLEGLVREGMSVARLNFSHGTHEEHKKRMDSLKAIRTSMNQPIAILLDTRGPEIRVKTFESGSVELKKDATFCLTSKNVIGNEKIVSITTPQLIQDVKVGDCVLLDDGLIELRVESKEHDEIKCTVLNGGVISDHKGVNVPGVHLSLPYLSQKDKNDIIFGIEQKVDFIAASFVRCGHDVTLLRDFLCSHGGQDIEIIAKIENAEGVHNIDEIIQLSDGIMIARGDMGVEIPYEDVPAIQKMIIKKVYQSGKKVITATQMLDSMMKNPRPTRAEATDVANAIYDGTSAIMLSGETAAGLYPIESLKAMVRIAEKTEEDIDYRKRFFSMERNPNPNVTDAISHATCTTALDLNTKAIITITKTGNSARMISRYRPACTIIACTTEEIYCRQLNLSWGVVPVLIDEKLDVMGLFEHALMKASMTGYIEKGDLVVLTSGIPLGVSGTTNMLRVSVV
ncbi:MAG: pyruvate kinase [Clostridiales bacterium]|nr:pyruvate kinase [Clostridiales bacterium]